MLTDFLPALVPLLGESVAGPRARPRGNADALPPRDAVVRARGRRGASTRCFLDDAQWADTATLTLVKVLVEDPELRQCLFVMAYRSEEVGDEHPTRLAIEAIRAAGITVHSLELAPLDVVHTTASARRRAADPSRVAAPLANAVHKKTAGNPLFVARFLHYLHDAGLFVFDRQTRAWHWDLAQIAEAPVTDNVVDLLVSAIARLPAECQSALAVAACIGARFELDLVADVSGMALDTIGRTLSPALHQELIIPLWPAHPGASATYRFAHDRIQQAVYSMQSEDAHRHLHLRIGRAAALPQRRALPCRHS